MYGPPAAAVGWMETEADPLTGTLDQAVYWHKIYTEIVRRYPNRVLAIYIRSIDLHEERITAVGRLAGRDLPRPLRYLAMRAEY